MMGVFVAVTQAAAEQQHGVVQQGPVPVRSRLQFVENMGKYRRVKLVDLLRLGDFSGIVPVMGQGVVSVAHPDGRIAEFASLMPQHDSYHSRHVGLERDHHQVSHQLGALFKAVAHTPMFHRVNAPLQVAYVFQMLIQLLLVATP